MTHIERQIIIDSPASTVFGLLSDPLRAVEWRVGLEQISEQEGQGQGSSFGWVCRMMGRRLQGRSTYSVVEPGRRLREQGEGMIGICWDWRLAELPGPRTALQLSVDYTLPPAVLGRIADLLIVERRNEHDIAQSLENLKQLAEGGPLSARALGGKENGGRQGATG